MATFERFEHRNIVECACPDRYVGEWRAVLEHTDRGDYMVTAIPHGPGSDCETGRADFVITSAPTRHGETRNFLTYEMALAWLEVFCGIDTTQGERF